MMTVPELPDLLWCKACQEKHWTMIVRRIMSYLHPLIDWDFVGTLVAPFLARDEDRRLRRFRLCETMYQYEPRGDPQATRIVWRPAPPLPPNMTWREQRSFRYLIRWRRLTRTLLCMLLADRLVSAEARVALLHRGSSVVAEAGSEAPAAGADSEYEIIQAATVNEIIQMIWIDLDERHADDLDTDEVMGSITDEVMGWHEIMYQA